MLDKSKLSRSLQSKELVIYNNKKYNFFVCNIIEGLEILEGWEYVEDALDDLSELILLQIKNINKINNKLFTVGGSKTSYTSLSQLTKLCQKITGNKINPVRKYLK